MYVCTCSCQEVLACTVHRVYVCMHVCVHVYNIHATNMPWSLTCTPRQRTICMVSTKAFLHGVLPANIPSHAPKLPVLSNLYACSMLLSHVFYNVCVMSATSLLSVRLPASWSVWNTPFPWRACSGLRYLSLYGIYLLRDVYLCATSIFYAASILTRYLSFIRCLSSTHVRADKARTLAQGGCAQSSRYAIFGQAWLVQLHFNKVRHPRWHLRYLSLHHDACARRTALNAVVQARAGFMRKVCIWVCVWVCIWVCVWVCVWACAKCVAKGGFVLIKFARVSSQQACHLSTGSA